ncbi:transglutaminase domain-containing protein [Clostridium botulinum]|uniref:Transglutaminase n=1 Tax=Clostridium botulinum TaxID=1491 RepID=A0A9Q1ZCD5_CLOBO|nr:transglutaminase domain-containing protein [Clostridium botulinum]AEB76592.1 predicted transglutaminase/protease, putative [Clostridium botulinum BKT015925]KEI00605.1 transglutaminase [Clostridium botulinum C/D str. Sp77]KLU76149.1 transglutaminase [Clostridium botulinum V891]KOA76983.1 transglutaminase [Clostridium botulinum]KOA77354.1 transglutaminase [Clostridium botulinum]
MGIKFSKVFKIYSIMTLMFLIMIFNCTKIVIAADSTYKVLNKIENVDIDKKWKINFNNKLNEDTLKNNIKIVDEDSKECLKIKVKYNDKDKFVNVECLSKYRSKGKYILIIEKGIKSFDGKDLSKGVKVNFTCKDYDEKINTNKSLLKENFKNPGNVANNKEDFYNILRYALFTFKSKITLTINNYNQNDYSLDIIADIIHDNPILDYGYKGANGSISSSMGKATMKLNLNYTYSKERMEYMRTESQNKVNDIIKKIIKPNMSDYEKELAIHDYIVNNSRYDERLFFSSIPGESYTDYGVLVKGVGVCESYAKAMYRLLNTAGIETLFVVGEGKNQNGIKEAHAWNIVKLYGEYYQLDTTWDNPMVPGGKKYVTHDYFNLTDSEMQKDHIWDKSKYPKCYSKTYSFKQKYVA